MEAGAKKGEDEPKSLAKASASKEDLEEVEEEEPGLKYMLAKLTPEMMKRCDTNVKEAGDLIKEKWMSMSQEQKSLLAKVDITKNQIRIKNRTKFYK